MNDKPFITLPADQPWSDELADLTLEQKAALPLRFHTPQWVDAEPPGYLCRVCWDEGEATTWPCRTAREARDDVFGQSEAVRAHAKLSVRLDAVRRLHPSKRIYDECGHDHDIDEPGVIEVEEVGYVCSDGFQYEICVHCCGDGQGYQTEECVSNHDHGKEKPACSTRAIVDGESTRDGVS